LQRRYTNGNKIGDGKYKGRWKIDKVVYGFFWFAFSSGKLEHEKKNKQFL
jgi:hypothetical protein